MNGFEKKNNLLMMRSLSDVLVQCAMTYARVRNGQNRSVCCLFRVSITDRHYPKLVLVNRVRRVRSDYAPLYLHIFLCVLILCKPLVAESTATRIHSQFPTRCPPVLCARTRPVKFVL